MAATFVIFPPGVPHTALFPQTGLPARARKDTRALSLSLSLRVLVSQAEDRRGAVSQPRNQLPPLDEPRYVSRNVSRSYRPINNKTANDAQHESAPFLAREMEASNGRRLKLSWIDVSLFLFSSSCLPLSLSLLSSFFGSFFGRGRYIGTIGIVVF